jgi:HlyD family secretion protein
MKRMGIVAVLLAAIAVVAFVVLRNGEETLAPVYQKVPVTSRNIVVSASAAGSIEPITTVEVKSKASGELYEVRAETGDVVRAGTILIRVDPRIPQNTLRQAEADLELAQAQLDNAMSQLRRSEELFGTQSITEQEYDTAKLSVASARAQLVRAERSLEDARIAAEDTEVKAPITGVIIQKNVEVGSVISSATGNVSGGTVLMQMANLDTVQVRALVDETDIGKIQPGMDVTIQVDAFRNRPFTGQVLKIEPLATVTQNVTMFPVLVRIPNPESLLKPGMNTEVEVHVGSREGVMAIPNAALRTQDDVYSAGAVLGLSPETVQEQLAAARRAASGGNQQVPGEGVDDGTVMWRGTPVKLPEGLSADEVQSVLAKVESASDMRSVFQSLSVRERTIMRQMSEAAGGGMRPGGGMGGGQQRSTSSANAALLGGDYIVFVMRNGAPTAVPVKTGLTDLDYSEVESGLTAADTVLILPSASLLASQQEMQERMARMTSGVPGAPGGGPRR